MAAPASAARPVITDVSMLKPGIEQYLGHRAFARRRRTATKIGPSVATGGADASSRQKECAWMPARSRDSDCRERNDLTHRFPLIVEALARLRSRACIIDGEAVCCGDDGVPSFDRIRYRRYDASVFLYAFDLIGLNGDDLRFLWQGA